MTINWERIARAVEALRDTLANPAVQKVMAFALPLLAALVRAIQRWLAG